MRLQREAELEKSLSLLQATLESTTEGVIAINFNGHIVSFNQKFVQMWQIPEFIIKSRNHNQSLTFYKNQLKDPETFCRCIEELDSQADVEGYDTLELKDGRVFEQYSQPLQLDEQIIGTVWSFRDITKRLQVEKEVHHNLAQEEGICEQKERFVSMICHEFRSSLNMISFSTSLLKRHRHSWSEEKKLQYLQRVQTTVEQLNQLMDEVFIIDTAQARKLKFEPKPLNLLQFCHDILAQMNLSESNQHTVTFVSQGDCQAVCLDKKLLQPILTNLLSNALKYSPKDSTVDVVLSYQDEKVLFQIKDRGIGIPKTDQQLLFEPFHRGGNVGDIPGNGLGLAIVKKLVDIHGGQIFVESEVGVGTTFTITLPFCQSVTMTK
ncbi:MAG: PAS domain-containing sensor histidine kinase [Brasilonema angustatum HA4187-MV1]|nr:PAS domain-containing sensor histidine kinase [Brasilonema angustatum HA4187-MV1]